MGRCTVHLDRRHERCRLFMAMMNDGEMINDQPFVNEYSILF
jgi:hypothetical protein